MAQPANPFTQQSTMNMPQQNQMMMQQLPEIRTSDPFRQTDQRISLVQQTSDPFQSADREDDGFADFEEAGQHMQVQEVPLHERFNRI